MYHAYWGLRESPFRGGLDLTQFYQTPNHEEALARLHFLVDERRRVGLLTGQAGSGKSMLLHAFAKQARQAGHEVVCVNLTAQEPRELLWSLAAALGRNPGLDWSTFVLWRALVDRVAENRYLRTNTVLLLDDADAAPRETLEFVQRLAQLDPAQDARLTIVLTSERQRLVQLGEPLLELAELETELLPWEAADTAGFLRFALAQAGRHEPVFTGEGAVRLHDLAEGLPRRIKQLADLALVAGAGLQMPLVNAEDVTAAYHELAVLAAPAAVVLSKR